MTPDFNITIIGAGVVGLAIAAALSKSYDKIVVVEKHSKFGQETSSRNSEVIHSGIYYPTKSLKARLCVEGKKLLYDYCDKKDIAYNKCGKLIVATNEEEEKELDSILKQSQLNGVDDGKRITAAEVKVLEPNVNALAALYFPSTGIIDSHGLMKQLQTDAINNGVDFAYNSEVVNIERKVLSPFGKGGVREPVGSKGDLNQRTNEGDRRIMSPLEKVPGAFAKALATAKGRGIENPQGQYKVQVKEEFETFSFTTNILINSAGLQSDKIAALPGIYDDDYKLHFWKGEYFGVGNGKNKLLNRLIYPVPLKNTAGLGVHATIDLSGGLKLGPNALYMQDKTEDYSVDPYNQWAFYESANRFLPFIEEEDLHPDQAGLRPKLQKPGDPVRDFIIKEESKNGFPGCINLIGMESPGLTASLAIGKYVKELVNQTTANN